MTRALTHDRLTEVLDYNPETGVFVWKVRMSKKFPVGRSAGGLRNGSFYVRIDEQDYTGARLAWFYVTGKWPHRLKFRDGDKTNIRVGNLVESMALPKEYDHSTPDGRIQYLRDHRAKYGEANKGHALRSKFGIDMDRYREMHADQGACCAICRKPETGTRNGKTITLAVDHNHTTGAVRDLLCRGCNQLIGNAKEDVGVLEAAIAYLRRHSMPAHVAEVALHPYHPECGLVLH